MARGRFLSLKKHGWRSRDQRRTEKDSKSENVEDRVSCWLLSILWELTESSLEKGGKTLTAEDSVHVVAEACEWW